MAHDSKMTKHAFAQKKDIRQMTELERAFAERKGQREAVVQSHMDELAKFQQMRKEAFDRLVYGSLQGGMVIEADGVKPLFDLADQMTRMEFKARWSEAAELLTFLKPEDPLPAHTGWAAKFAGAPLSVPVHSIPPAMLPVDPPPVPEQPKLVSVE